MNKIILSLLILILVVGCSPYDVDYCTEFGKSACHVGCAYYGDFIVDKLNHTKETSDNIGLCQKNCEVVVK